MVQVLIEHNFFKFHGKMKQQKSESTICTKFAFIYIF